MNATDKVYDQTASIIEAIEDILKAKTGKTLGFTLLVFSDTEEANPAFISNCPRDLLAIGLREFMPSIMLGIENGCGEEIEGSADPLDMYTEGELPEEQPELLQDVRNSKTATKH